MSNHEGVSRPYVANTGKHICINLCQELNTMMWDKLNNGVDFEDVQDIVMDIANLNILSNIEINY